MATYTVELRDIVKSDLKIFNFPYVFYDETKKDDFENKFINHFYFREIGFETVGRFQHYLKTKCDEILPYYNMLLTTAEYDYDLKNNYNLTETFTKTNSSNKTLSGQAEQNGINTESSNNSGTVNRDVDVTSSGDKTNTLDSTTNHTDNTDFDKKDDYKDTNYVDNLQTVINDNKKVGSKTPNGLLKMDDIKNNVYADQADIENGQVKTFEKKDEQLKKTIETKENTEQRSSDIVDATSRDITNESSRQQDNQSISNVGHTSNDFTNTSTNTQNESDTGSESYTLERVGDIGIDTTPDKLKKHIELQKTLTTVYIQFFNECEELFMQVF